MESHADEDPLSPSFVDSAIDLDVADPAEIIQNESDRPSDAANSTVLSRLSRITSLAAEALPHGLDAEQQAAMDECLARLEEILDPRPSLSREIAKSRPHRSRSNTATLNSASRSRRCSHSGGVLVKTSDELSRVLEELTVVTNELQQRREDMRHMRELFVIKREELTRRVQELEGEVHELRSDVHEGAIELESLRGTVRGLESWINEWEHQRETTGGDASAARATRKNKNPWRRKRRSRNGDKAGDSDLDALLDGISAWMRGWHDIDEEVRTRARWRHLRRERRDSLQSREGSLE